MASSDPWWLTGVVYQVYPRSFCDGDGDGIGDLAGLRRHLDHIADLGVDAVWTTPIFRSPMADNGYDVSDYCDVDPVFGDVAAVDALLEELHARDLRLLLDWVPNHTSDRHPWFVESRSSRESPHRDWYYWRNGTREQPPNNWRSVFGGPAWTWDEHTAQWYLHSFLAEQPDLNWGNPQVRDAMHATLRFWLDRGVDGFRMDVVHLIGKDPALPNAPADKARVNLTTWHDEPRTHELIRGIRGVLDGYPGDRMMVGEVNLRELKRLATYYGAGDELHLVFDFRSTDIGWDADAWADLIDAVERELQFPAWPTWVLSNHDLPRHRTRLGGSEVRSRAMAVLLLTLRGTPFLYAGEELGLEDAVIPADRVNDVVGRDGCRAPIPWSPQPPHGWNGAAPWLPFPPEPEHRNVESMVADGDSILWLYRRLLSARRASPALQAGTLQRLPAPPGVLAYARRAGDDVRRVVVNFTDAPVAIGFGGFAVELSSEPGGGSLAAGSVPGQTAVVLRPQPPAG